MKKFDIKIVDKTTLNEQVSVFRESFEVDDDYETMKYTWECKHYCNPQGDSIVFAAYDEKLMVGINAFMPVNYKVGDKIIKAVQSCESGVRKDYRRKGIWKSIMIEAMEYFRNKSSFDIMIGFPNYLNSYSGFIKLGWTDVCNMSNSIMVINGKMTIEALFGRTKINSLGNILNVQKLIPVLNNCKSELYCLKMNDYKSFSNICCIEEENISLDINEESILWKKKYKDLDICTIYKDKMACGIFCGGYNNLNGIQYYEIHRCIKLCIKENDYQKSFAFYLNTIIKEKNCAFIRVWEKDGDSNRNLYRKNLFIKTEKHRNPFIVYLLNNNIELKEKICDSKFWRLSMLDLD